MDEKEFILKIYLRTNKKERFYISLLSYIILILYLIYTIFINIRIFIYSIIILIISYIIKEIVKKERPIDLFDNERNVFIDNYSFPSIHTILSIFLFLSFIKNPIFYPILIVPILRILSLRHWISDIIYSSIISILIYIITIV
ncbi:hypothetical protein YN1_3020 [Nanoarchaeota archaeon]